MMLFGKEEGKIQYESIQCPVLSLNAFGRNYIRLEKLDQIADEQLTMTEWGIEMLSVLFSYATFSPLLVRYSGLC